MGPQGVAADQRIPSNYEGHRIQPGVCRHAVHAILAQFDGWHMVDPGPYLATARISKAKRLAVLTDDCKVVATKNAGSFAELILHAVNLKTWPGNGEAEKSRLCDASGNAPPLGCSGCDGCG